MAGYDYSLLKGRVRGTTGWQDANLDGASGDLVTKGEREHRASEGTRFFYMELNTLAVGIHRQILITTPAGTKQTHLEFNVTADKETTVELWEDASTTASGTFVSGFNYDRGSATSGNAGTHLSVAPTITISGTRMINVQIGAALGPHSTNQVINTPLILETGKTYLMDVRADVTDDDVQIFLDWFEHTNES